VFYRIITVISGLTCKKYLAVYHSNSKHNVFDECRTVPTTSSTFIFLP